MWISSVLSNDHCSLVPRSNHFTKIRDNSTYWRYTTPNVCLFFLEGKKGVSANSLFYTTLCTSQGTTGCGPTLNNGQ